MRFLWCSCFDVSCFDLDPMTLTYKLDLDITRVAKINVLAQGFQKLENEQDRQTDRQRRPKLLRQPGVKTQWLVSQCVNAKTVCARLTGVADSTNKPSIRLVLTYQSQRQLCSLYELILPLFSMTSLSSLSRQRCQQRSRDMWPNYFC